MERDFFRDFFTSSKSADWLIALCCGICFALSNAFFWANFFTSSPFVNFLIIIIGGAIAYAVHAIFLQLLFALLVNKGFINSIFHAAFFRFSIIFIAAASLIKGILYVVFSGYIGFSAMVIPILYAAVLSASIFANIYALIKGNFLRFEKRAQAFVYVVLPFFGLALIKLLFLGVL